MTASIVCGGAGFLGSHLVDTLAKRGESIVVVDNLTTGHLGNLEAAITSGRVTFVYVDSAVDAPALRNVIMSIGMRKIDYVYLFASSADSTETVALIELALEHRARLVLASNAEVRSSFDPITPRRSSDGENRRRFAENEVAAAVRERGLDARIVRYSHCYGPRANSEDAPHVAGLLDAALHRRPMPIQGTGRQAAPMTYVTDAIERLIVVARRNQATLEPVNIADRDECNVIDIARVLARTAGIDFRIEHIADLHVVPQSGRTHASDMVTLKWAPSTSLEMGLRATYEWFAKEQRLFV